MKKKLRALHITGSSKFGGGAYVVLEYMRVLRDNDIDTEILTTNNKDIILPEKEGFKVLVFEGINRKINPFVDLYVVFKLAKVLKGKYDIVHTHTSKGGAIGRLAAKLAGVAVIFHTVHGFSFHEFSGRLTKCLFSCIEAVLSHFCDCVISVNNYDRIHAIANGIISKEKIVTVYNGIDPRRLPENNVSYRQEALDELGLPGDSILVVSVGRLEPQKGLYYLIQAVSKLRKIRPKSNIQLILVGDGEQRDRCKQWCQELGILHCVHMLGFRENAVRWTNVADIFVLSSLWEGHSITLLEAMGCGRPIVATDIKGNRETITNGYDGILVEPANSDALVSGILEVVDSDILATKIATNARKTFYDKYTSGVMKENVWRIYERYIREKINVT